MPDFRKIEYIDAHFSYKKEVEPPVGFVVSCGKVISETPNFIDLQVAWSENPDQTTFGLVIPKSLLLGNNSVFSIQKDSYSKKDLIAVYWDDIFAYDEEYKRPHILTPMLTEGYLISETDKYILIDNPETLNLKETKNHPEKKPQRYYIPKSMIKEIKIVKKYEE